MNMNPTNSEGDLEMPPTTTTNDSFSEGGPSESLSEIPLERGETGASLPAAEEVRTDTAARRGASANTWLCYSIFFLVILISIIAIGVGLSGRNTSSSSSRDGLAEGNVRKISVESLAAYLEENGVTALTTIYDFETPQAQAAQWLANEDPRNLALPSTGVNMAEGYHFVTRYVLATLYFALSGLTWVYQFNFLSQDDICAWRGVLYSANTGEAIPFGALCDGTGLIYSLYLDRNRLSGTLPPELTQLTTLRDLDFNFNYNIQGQIPWDISKMGLLQRLAITSNKLTGSIPDGLCNLRFLRGLFAGYNQISGKIPSCIGQLSNMQLFFVADNLLTGWLPESMADMTLLQMLWLDDNLFTGNVATTFDRMSFLQALFLEQNEFEGEMTESFLSHNKMLIELDLSNNDFTGSLPEHFLNADKYPALKMFDVHNNRLDGVLPSNVSHSGLRFLSLYGNSIGGEIPDSWINLDGLFHLDLSSNFFDGTMPEFFGNMTLLNYLFLANNTFTEGPIPESYSELKGLEELSLKRTRRTGPLPEWMADLDSLILLDLDQNDFTGFIPESYGNLTDLQFLLLNRNNLRGEVPQSFAKLTRLRAFFMEKNSIQGSINFMCDMANFNETFGDRDGTEIIAADCRGLSGEVLVECRCCEICCIPSFTGGTEDEGLEDEETCHDATAIANLNPLWEAVYQRFEFDFGNATRFIDREFLN